MNEHLSEAIRLLVLAMNDENGVSAEVYNGFRDLVDDAIGSVAEDAFVRGINATEGRFYWRSEAAMDNFMSAIQQH